MLQILSPPIFSKVFAINGPFSSVFPIVLAFSTAYKQEAFFKLKNIHLHPQLLPFFSSFNIFLDLPFSVVWLLVPLFHWHCFLKLIIKSNLIIFIFRYSTSLRHMTLNTHYSWHSLLSISAIPTQFLSLTPQWVPFNHNVPFILPALFSVTAFQCSISKPCLHKLPSTIIYCFRFPNLSLS